MSNKQSTTKICKNCKAEIAKAAVICPHCGKKVKKSGCLTWMLISLAVLIGIIALTGGGEDNTKDPYKVGEVESLSEQSTSIQSSEPTSTVDESEAAEDISEITTENVKTVYSVGDILQDGELKIVYVASGVYKEENEFLQPQDGNQYIFLQFAFENSSSSSDVSISSFSFECYADGYAQESYYGGEEDLSATLSAGRSTLGYVYFEVPKDAEEIEIEYETNLFTDEKIKFVFEGEKDSGYKISGNTSATPGAYKVGDVLESDELKISYLSCETYKGKYSTPRDGYRFVTLKFEFENIDDDDEYIAYTDFDCYADGIFCEGNYERDDEISATLSQGRKATGTVTYEVPLDAEVIEVEYLANYWTSDRIVFTVE